MCERDRHVLFDWDWPVLYEWDRVSCVSGIGMSCTSGIGVSCYLYYPLLSLQYWICQSQGQKVSALESGTRAGSGSFYERDWVAFMSGIGVACLIRIGLSCMSGIGVPFMIGIGISCMSGIGYLV